jgi:hypothetical protein
VRDEAEQVRYLEELSAIFAEEGVMLPGGPGTGYDGPGWEP